MIGSEKRDIFAHIFKIELLAPHKLSAIKCTTHFVVKVTCCGVMAERAAFTRFCLLKEATVRENVD